MTKFRLCSSCNHENVSFNLSNFVGGIKIRCGTLKLSGLPSFSIEEGTTSWVFWLKFFIGCYCPWHEGCYHFWHWAVNTPSVIMTTQNTAQLSQNHEVTVLPGLRTNSRVSSNCTWSTLWVKEKRWKSSSIFSCTALTITTIYSFNSHFESSNFCVFLTLCKCTLL